MLHLSRVKTKDWTREAANSTMSKVLIFLWRALKRIIHQGVENSLKEFSSFEYIDQKEKKLLLGWSQKYLFTQGQKDLGSSLRFVKVLMLEWVIAVSWIELKGRRVGL